MLLIALSFLYILALSLPLGWFLERRLGIDRAHPSLSIFNGWILVSLLAGIWGFFGRIHWEFQVALIALSLVCAYIERDKLPTLFNDFKFLCKEYPLFLKVYLILATLLVLAKAATAPYLPDNESYYIQTIQWLNERGFVPGLGNLHFFLGQTSGWHVLQSVFNLNFIYGKFNDLSALALLLGNFWAARQLKDYFINRELNALIFGSFGLAQVLWMQFCSSPSPDVPVYVLAFMITELFVRHFTLWNRKAFRQMLLLVLLALWIKVTSVGLVFLPILYAFYHKQFRSFFQLPILLPSLAFLGLYLSKNAVITGYLLFPITLFSWDSIHKIPEEILYYFNSNARPMAFDLTIQQMAQLGPIDKFLHWMRLPGLHGLLNSLSVIGLLGMGLLSLRTKNKAWSYIVGVIAIQFVLLYLFSPQYRFNLHFTLLSWFFIVWMIMGRFQILVRPILLVAMLLPVVPLWVPMHLGQATATVVMQTNPNFRMEQLLEPHGNSISQTTFTKIRRKGLEFYNPNQPTFFWFTGNGPLPCVNQEQLKFMEDLHHYRPIEMSCGFISVFDDPEE